MKITFGPKILLPTKYGNFKVTHVNVSLNSELIREGVLLHRECNDTIEMYVRIQSSCLFSETFWSTDCDCALQLQESMQIISQKGGYLLYFYEEGRGAGLNVKFKAIELQQLHNYDTKAAYECLNIKIDVRTYVAAATVLKKVLQEKPIVLLTNNEGKVNGLKQHGINIKRRESLICGTDNPAVKNYLIEKRDSLGHLIDLI